MRSAIALLTLAFALAPATADAGPEDSSTVLLLRDEAGEPVADANVTLLCAGRDAVSLKSDDTGKVTLERDQPTEGCELIASRGTEQLTIVLEDVDPRTKVVLRPRVFERKVVVKAARPSASVGRVVTVEEFRELPVGSTSSRDFTSVVESSATASVGRSGRRVARRRRTHRVARRRGRSGEARRGRAWQQQAVGGMLTAAAVDDVDNPDAFRRYLATVESPFKDRFSGRHKILQVLDPQGRPVAGAFVTAGERTYRTRRDGRVVLIPGWDPIGETGQTVAVPGGDGLSSTADADITQVVLGKTIDPPTPTVDLAFVVDTTGSMSDELTYLQAELHSILAALQDEYANLDIRWGLVVYRDTGDEYVAKRHEFTRDFDTFGRELMVETAMGGGDNPEAVDIAFEEANALSWRDAAEAGRVLVHIADAPPHDALIGRAFEQAERLRRDGTAIYPVAASGTDATTEFTMRTTALMSGGQYVFLTDDSGIGGHHREATEACYRVDTLLAVLTKILRAEIEGRRAELPIGPDGTGCTEQLQQR